METKLANFIKPVRILKPVRAFPCPKELRLVPGTQCRDCEDQAQAERPHKNFWVHCGFQGGGMEYAAMRAEMRERVG